MIRMKGDIIRQLCLLYPEYSFKNKFRNDFKNRIIFFFDQLLKERTLSESLELSKKYCIIENNEIKLFTEQFLKEHKIDLFNSFNPLWIINKRIYKKKEIIEPEIDASEELLECIIDNFLINKFNSAKINEDLREFKTRNTFFGNEIKFNVKKETNILLEFKVYDVNNHWIKRESLQNIISSNKKINFNTITNCLLRFKGYTNILLRNNPFFNIYLTREAFLSLNTRYERSYQKKDFCLTFVPEKNKFLLLKTKDKELGYFVLLKEIKEKDILNHKEFYQIKDSIEFMLLIANKYRKLREFVKTLLIDDEGTRTWTKDNFVNNIDTVFSLHQEE